jgi:hypothetical protein
MKPDFFHYAGFVKGMMVRFVTLGICKLLDRCVKE